MPTDGHRCPQADDGGEQVLINDEGLMKILWINMQVFDDLFGGLR